MAPKSFKSQHPAVPVNERNDIPSGWILKWLSCFKDATMTKLMVKDQQHYETLRCLAIPFFTPSGWP